MLKNYFDKTKGKLFPEITDWTQNYSERRLKNPNNMTHKEWFWFSPSAYKFMYYGIHVCSILIFVAMATFSFFKISKALSGIMLIFAGLVSYQLYKRIKTRHLITYITFYDTFLRE